MIRLRVLGSTELTHADGREISSVLTQPKRLALLAYLAVNSGYHRRDTLLAMFWPELDTDRSRDALNQAVRFLRKELCGENDSVIVSRGATELGIARDKLWCDAAALRSAFVDGRHRDALELYRGDLLVGFFADGTDGFERWLETERDQLRAAAARAAMTEADVRERSGDHEAAIMLARRAVELARRDERAVRELLERLHRLGDRAGALHAYEDFAKQLAAELNAEPAPETTSLVHLIRRHSGAARSDATAVMPTDPPVPSASHVEAVPFARRSTARRSRAWLGLGIAGGSLTAAALAAGMWKDSEAPPVRVTLELPDSAKLHGGMGFSFAMSPDGQRFAFIVGNDRKILVRSLDRTVETFFPNTPSASDLHFSPDGSALAYRIGGRPSGPAVLHLDRRAAGAAPVPRDTTLGWIGITWGKSRDVIYVLDDALWRMSRENERPVRIAGMDTTVDRRWRQPTVLSDGKTIAMRVTPRDEFTNGRDRLALISIDGGERKLLDFIAESAIGDIDGVLVYSRNGPVLGQGQIVGVRFDLGQKQVWGPHVVLIDSVDTNTGSGAIATMAENGSLAYAMSFPKDVLQIIDEREGLLREVRCPRSCSQLAWSPDGRYVAMYSGADVDPALAVYDVKSDTIRRFPGTIGFWPSWTGDSKRIVFTGKDSESFMEGPAMWVAADGRSPAERIPGTEKFGSGVLQALVTPDNRHVIVRTFNKAGESQHTLHAFAAPLGGEATALPKPVITESASPYSLQISPNGKWLAYTGPHRGPRAATFVQPLMGGGGRVQVSPAQGFYPQWSADGRKLVYKIEPGGFGVATLDHRGPLPRVIRTDSLFTDESFRNIGSWDAHPSERRYAVTRMLGKPPELKLVTNFPALVREKLGLRR